MYLKLSIFLSIFLFYTYSPILSQTIYLSTFLDSTINGDATIIGSKIISFDTTNCSVKELCSIRKANFTDITIHPNGLLYGLSSESEFTINGIFEFDIKTCMVKRVIDLPQTYVGGMVCMSNGDIYLWVTPIISGVAYSKLYKYRPEVNLLTHIGDFIANISCTSMTVANGKVYGVGFDTNSNMYILVDVNLVKPSDSVILYSQAPSLTIDPFGSYSLVSLPGECGNDYTFSQGLNSSNLWSIDLDDGSFILKCKPNFLSNGATSPLEFLASDPECELLFDLDRDNSSGEYPYDFRNDGILCLDDKKTHTVDTDVFLHTAADLDSIIISLSGDMDGASEILTLGGSLPNASLTYRNGIYRLTLMGDRSDASWLAALRAIQYQNTSITPSAGLRTITFTAYNAIKSNQAKTFIRIGSHPYAGRDTSLVVCASMQIDGISQRLGGQSGGFWSPPLSVYNNYNSDTDLATTYYYIAESADCGLDTAVVHINRLPLRTLDLGPDVSLCRAESHLIAIPTIAGDQIRWQDGNTSSNRSINIPGTYKVSITTSDGCIITDSITITRSYSKVEKTSTIDLCKGQPYDYHGKIYQAGATIVDSLNATTGCDTLLTIVLRPIPTPTISRDTTTCDDQPISIQGKTYQIGDTIISSKPSAIGCDTLISLAYKKHISSVNGVYLTDSLVCEGSKRVVIFESNHFADLIWSNGDSSKVADFGPGQHFVQAIDSLGCLRIIPFEIKAYPMVQYEVQTTDPLCQQANGSIKIINKNPDLVFTTVITGIETHHLTNLNAGNYNIVITDVNDCLTYDTLTLTDINDFDVSMPSNIDGQLGQFISIAYQSTGGSIDTIAFSPQSDIAWVTDSILVSIKDDRVYSITFVDENGCIVTKSLTIQARIPINTYILPDMVSIQSTNPENTLFYLKNEDITYDMSIYDRWGNLIYQVQSANGGDASQAWEPQKSKVVPGVYVYLINIDTIDGKIQKYGTVTVL